MGDLVNPSFLLVAREGRFLYSAHGDEQYASSFSINRYTGEAMFLGQADTGGVNGASIAASPDGRFMIVANYASGSVAVLPVRHDGTLVDRIQVVALEGNPGPHRVEQTGSHPHQIVFDPSGQFVLVPDKGLDRIFVFRFDTASGRLSPAETASTPVRSGSGPRHLTFHPKLPLVWVLNELSSTVATYSWDPARGTLKALQILSSVPADFTQENTASEIVASKDGKFVYFSNRGHDSIGAFEADARTGLLKPLAWTGSLGKSPRFITFDPRYRFLYAANEKSDNIAAFRVDSSSGRLTAAGEPISQTSPVSIVFSKGD